jgi:signal transduction histidine kinase
MQAHPLSSPAARNLNPSGTLSSISEGPGLAHDAGNLLGALGLYCDLLDLPGVLRPEHLHYARELRLLSQRSGALIHRLLEGPQEPVAAISRSRPKRLSAGTVVRAFAPLLRSLGAPEATVSMTVAHGLPILPFAPEVLERILVNLTRNAAMVLRAHGSRGDPGMPEYLSPGCRIHIGVSGDAAGLHLTVTDNGPGMTPAVVAEFLKPKPLPRGALSGLGHRVVHDLVQSTSGQLSIETAPGRGTKLQIDWPIVAARTNRHNSSSKTYQEGVDLSC